MHVNSTAEIARFVYIEKPGLYINMVNIWVGLVKNSPALCYIQRHVKSCIYLPLTPRLKHAKWGAVANSPAGSSMSPADSAAATSVRVCVCEQQFHVSLLVYSMHLCS